MKQHTCIVYESCRLWLLREFLDGLLVCNPLHCEILHTPMVSCRRVHLAILAPEDSFPQTQ